MEADDEHMLEKVKKNVVCMLNDRNIPEDDSEISLNDDRFMWGMKRGTILVVVYKGVMQAIFGELEECQEKNHISHCIVVCWSQYTPAASKYMLQNKGFYEQFLHAEFVAPAIHSILVPKHKILSEQEKQNMMKKYHIKNPVESLPRILTTDKVQRWFNAPLGSVYKIIKRNGVTQPQMMYRVVCEPFS